MRVNVLRTCKSCLAEVMYHNKTISLKSAKKLCECFKFNHDKTKIGKLTPHTKEYEEASKIIKDNEKKIQLQQIQKLQRDKDIRED